jgi:hypothetical protein
LPHPVKSYGVYDGVISLAVTRLLAKRQASFRGQELYPGLVTELGNLHDNAKGRVQWVHPRGSKPMNHVGAD